VLKIQFALFRVDFSRKGMNCLLPVLVSVRLNRWFTINRSKCFEIESLRFTLRNFFKVLIEIYLLLSKFKFIVKQALFHVQFNLGAEVVK